MHGQRWRTVPCPFPLAPRRASSAALRMRKAFFPGACSRPSQGFPSGRFEQNQLRCRVHRGGRREMDVTPGSASAVFFPSFVSLRGHSLAPAMSQLPCQRPPSGTKGPNRTHPSRQRPAFLSLRPGQAPGREGDDGAGLAVGRLPAAEGGEACEGVTCTPSCGRRGRGSWRGCLWELSCPPGALMDGPASGRSPAQGSRLRLAPLSGCPRTSTRR